MLIISYIFFLLEEEYKKIEEEGEKDLVNAMRLCLECMI